MGEKTLRAVGGGPVKKGWQAYPEELEERLPDWVNENSVDDPPKMRPIGMMPDDDDEEELPVKKTVPKIANSGGEKVRVNIYLSTGMERRLRLRAVDSRKSLSAIIEAALVEYL